MMFHPHSRNGPLMKAAQMALVTGDVNCVLIWVPEEFENTLKNLLEKTCCERSARKIMQNRAIDWYFDTVNRFHSAKKGALYPCLKPGGVDQSQIAAKVESAIETGNFDEIIGIIPDTHAADVRERFHHVMDKSNFDRKNIAAGRAYVSAFIDFLTYVYTIRTGIPGEENYSK